MDSSLIYTMILLLNVFEALARKIYNTDEKEMHFACSSQRQPKENEIIKLYLTNKNLRIRCFFQTENEVASKGMLSIFTSGGLAPSLAIVNSTYHGIFHFNLTLISDRVFWLIDIPRENITGNTDIAATEQWLVKISLHAGLNIYDTEGTLLDVVREPILQWSLGKKMKATELQTLYPYVVGLKVTKCPCANDVALIGFVLNATYNGVYIGRTFSGFWKYWETIWFNLTDLIYTELQEEHKELTLIDIVLTNRFLVILTSLGLFVSGDLRYPITPNLKLSRADFCGFEKDGGPEQFGFYYHVDPFRPMGGRFKDLVVWDGNLEQNDVSITLCKPQFDDTEHTPVRLTMSKENCGIMKDVLLTENILKSSSCFYSREPFLDWLPCLPYSSKGAKNTPSVITFLIDQEHNTGIYLLYNQANKLTTVSVSMLKNNQPSSRSKFPNFNFPLMFSAPAGLVFHPRSHFLYAYGDQVWLSMDGGNTFELIAELNGNDIKYSFHSFYTSDITFASKNGKIYLTKAGLTRYTVIGKITNKIFTLYYDHLGFIHKLTPTNFDAGRTLTALGNSRGIFGQPPDLGFETALAPQYISPKEIAFFAYVPVNEPKATIYKKKFKNIHQGKVIHFSKGGRVYIRNILYHKYPEGFLSSVLTEVLEPFGVEEANESSCVTSTLAIEHYNNNTYQLNLDQNDNSSFQATDVGKTVVIPGSSSFLITTVSGPKSALSLATMPESVFTNMTFPPETWFLYDFGQTNGRLWHIYTRPCQFWFQQMDDEALSLNLVKYIDLGNFQDFIIKIIPNTDGSPTREVPPVKVVVGNPTLLEVKSDGIFDDTDNYKAVVLTSNRSLRQGFTSVALMVWEASTECFVTTLVPILKSSCSYLRSMRHTPTKFIPPEDWISGIHKDSQGFNMIKTLPINYRPPSNMGIAIPLTDNFYHADPSKPIPRNLFHKSKEYGKYKQCANATTREQCNCTNDQKTSQAVAFSDCKEKVRRFKFPIQQYPVVLEIFSEGEKIPVKPPYLVTVTEVNMRKNWELKHTLSEKVRKMKDYLEPILRASVYNPSGLNLSIKIYVDEVPLPFPGHTLIAVASAVALGGLIFIAFIFQLRNIHPLRALRRCFTRNKVTLSNISVTQ